MERATVDQAIAKGSKALAAEPTVETTHDKSSLVAVGPFTTGPSHATYQQLLLVSAISIGKA